ncbi:SacI phosphoinositide polyphosphatase, partial [Hamiltosporidium tvaerminnensis]
MTAKIFINENKNEILLLNTVTDNLITISRIDESIKKGKSNEFEYDGCYLIYGIFGLIHLNGGSYIICIDKVSNKGEYFGKCVYEIKSILIFKLKNIKENISDSFEIKMIKNFFTLPGIFFCENDLFVGNNYGNESKNFLFNYNLMNNFIGVGEGCEEFVLKCIQGYFGSFNFNNLSVVLISRRSWKRVGSRYFSRGCDKKGFSSNFVETEQIFIKDKNVYSFTQVRGSIPLLWKHVVDIKYKPRYTVLGSWEVFKLSNQIFTEYYGNIYYLNLIHKQGYEKKIGDEFTKVLRKKKCNFCWTDFIKAGCLFNEDLTEIISREVEKCGYFSSVGKKQSGIIRTNCIDCLDRTNVAQYKIQQIISKKINQENKLWDESLENAIKNDFKRIWFENGNYLSHQYAGTASLKSWAIYNKKVGKIFDLIFTIKRYFLGRFYDGDIQNGYDLVTGNYKDMQRKELPLSFFLIFYTLVMLFSGPSETLKNNKIKTANEADELHPPANYLPSSLYTKTTHPPPNQTSSNMQNSGFGTILSPNTPHPSLPSYDMTNPYTLAIPQGNRLMILRTIFDSVTADQRNGLKLFFFFAVQIRFERMPRNGWTELHRYYNEKFGCTKTIKEIKSEENRERRRIATCIAEPCTLTDTTEYINLRDKFLSKIKDITEKEIEKVVVGTRKLPSELVDSKVLDLINRIIGDYADSCVPMTITVVARKIQAAQICSKVNIKSKVSRLVLSKDLFEKARKQEKISSAETNASRKSCGCVTDLSEALVKKNEFLNVYEKKNYDLIQNRFYRGLSERVESEHVVSRDEIVITYDDYLIPFVSDNHPTMFPSLDEFVNIINWLPNWKAAGIDGIYNFFIKKLTTLHKYLYDIVKVIRLEETPQADWFYCGLTYLIPKGIPQRGSDYRLIVVCTTSTIVQILVERRGLLAENQLGAVRGVQG